MFVNASFAVLRWLNVTGTLVYLVYSVVVSSPTGPPLVHLEMFKLHLDSCLFALQRTVLARPEVSVAGVSRRRHIS